MVEEETLFVTERFQLNEETQEQLRALQPSFGFDSFGELVYYRTYSRILPESGGQECWADTVIRVIQGIMSIRKDHSLKHRLGWSEEDWQRTASGMARSMFHMQWLPSGRGLWAMGTQYVYQRGSAALNNCGFVSSVPSLARAAEWTMDMLMCGCGVGIDMEWRGAASAPDKQASLLHVVADSREGWVESVSLLLRAYLHEPQPGAFPRFDYSKIRAKGSPLRSFGGTASGPEPLKKLHRRLEAYLDAYSTQMVLDEAIRTPRVFLKHLLPQKTSPALKEVIYTPLIRRVAIWAPLLQKLADIDGPCSGAATSKGREQPYDTTRLIADVMNAIGACVVAGNVRRSSEILLGSPEDATFLDLKDYRLNPERASIGWMSNNSIRLTQSQHFLRLPLIAERMRRNGEPGFMNCLNVRRFGRVGRRCHHLNRNGLRSREQEEDAAVGMNPCGEIALESFELCNLAEVFPSRCLSPEDDRLEEEHFMTALKYATLYASTVSLLPTHCQESNAVIARNRRIGVSLSGIADIQQLVGPTRLIELCHRGYAVVRAENQRLACEAGVKEGIRVTTVKPSGSISLLAGVSPGMHHPTFRYAIRRIRVQEGTPIAAVLSASGLPSEPDSYSDNTLVFEFPIDQGSTRAAQEVSLWEQFSLLVMLQREWSDNAVSFTGYFNPESEAEQLEQVLAYHAPLIKGCSLLPHTKNGVYAQAPYEGITREEYEQRKASMAIIDWSSFRGSDGERPLYCSNESCAL